MPVITNFGDSNTVGNTTLQQNLTVQGAFSQFYGNIYSSSSSVGIGNVATPFGNVFTVSANITAVNTASLISQNNFQVQGNIVSANGLTTTNVFATSSNISGLVNTFSLIITSNVGIGTAPNGNSLSIQGNAYVSNSVTTTNVAAASANVSGTTNTQTLIATSNIGIGAAPFGNALSVQGNVYVSNSIQTTNITGLNFVNVSIVSNTTTLIATSNIGVGTAPFGNAMSIQGNLWVSNALTTTNVQAALMNVTTMNATTANVTTLNAAAFVFSTLNLTTLNTVSIYGQSGSVGVGTSTNLGATLQVQGNVYASNGFQGSNLSLTRTIYYNEDLFKRGPYLTPDGSNAFQIQAWISATCNASSQPSKSWWATSPNPVYGNAAVGAFGTTDYGGSVLLPDGRVLFVPQNSSNVGIYSPATGLFSSVTPAGFSAISGQFRSGVLVPNGNVIFIPWNSSNVGVFNPLTYDYASIAVGAAAAGSGYRFQGAVLGPTGNVIMVPRDSANIGVFDPTALTLTNVGPIAGQGLSLFGAGTLLPNGNVVMSPLATGSNIGMYNAYSLSASGFTNVGPIASSGTWESATLAPNGNVIFAPSASANVVVYNPTFVSNPISAGGFSNVQTNVGTIGGGNYFKGSTLLPSGNVIFCPADTSNIGMFDPTALTYSNCALMGSGTAKFYGCTLLPSGQVVFTPATASNVGLLNTMVPAPIPFCLSPFFNKF